LEVVFSLQSALKFYKQDILKLSGIAGGDTKSYRQTHRQQSDLINLPLFFKIRNVSKKGHSSQKVAEEFDSSSKIHM
jgi:5'(3')-deoxyribonucleotidase